MNCADYHKAVGARIREIRVAKGFMARRAGRSKGNLSKVERGSNAGLETLCRLADALDVSVKEFLP